MLIAALSVGALLTCNTVLRAQDSTNTPPAGAPPAGQRPPGMRGAPNLDMLAKQLELTDEQKTKIKPILEEQAKKIKDLRADTSLLQEDRRAKMKAIRDEVAPKMKEILTPEQFAKFEKMGQRRGGPQGGGAGAPPAGEKPPQN
jgi:Spy/CpxP family protein refolding chaperone